jgi:hypothetical protein
MDNPHFLPGRPRLRRGLASELAVLIPSKTDAIPFFVGINRNWSQSAGFLMSQENQRGATCPADI